MEGDRQVAKYRVVRENMDGRLITREARESSLSSKTRSL